MKQGIHPQYVECTVTCSCGNTFKTHATVSEMKVELCNECHPFYTGQQKFVDTGGRVQRLRLPRRLSVPLSSPRRLPSRLLRLPQRLPSRRPLPRPRPPRLLSK